MESGDTSSRKILKSTSKPINSDEEANSAVSVVRSCNSTRIRQHRSALDSDVSATSRRLHSTPFDGNNFTGRDACSDDKVESSSRNEIRRHTIGVKHKDSLKLGCAGKRRRYRAEGKQERLTSGSLSKPSLRSCKSGKESASNVSNERSSRALKSPPSDIGPCSDPAQMEEINKSYDERRRRDIEERLHLEELDESYSERRRHSTEQRLYVEGMDESYSEHRLRSTEQRLHVQELDESYSERRRHLCTNQTPEPTAQLAINSPNGIETARSCLSHESAQIASTSSCLLSKNSADLISDCYYDDTDSVTDRHLLRHFTASLSHVKHDLNASEALRRSSSAQLVREIFQRSDSSPCFSNFTNDSYARKAVVSNLPSVNDMGKASVDACQTMTSSSGDFRSVVSSCYGSSSQASSVGELVIPNNRKQPPRDATKRRSRDVVVTKKKQGTPAGGRSSIGRLVRSCLVSNTSDVPDASIVSSASASNCFGSTESNQKPTTLPAKGNKSDDKTSLPYLSKKVVKPKRRTLSAESRMLRRNHSDSHVRPDEKRSPKQRNRKSLPEHVAPSTSCLSRSTRVTPTRKRRSLIPRLSGSVHSSLSSLSCEDMFDILRHNKPMYRHFSDSSDDLDTVTCNVTSSKRRTDKRLHSDLPRLRRRQDTRKKRKSFAGSESVCGLSHDAPSRLPDTRGANVRRSWTIDECTRLNETRTASDDSFNDSRLTVETALKNYSLASDLQNSTLETLLNVCYTQIARADALEQELLEYRKYS